MNVEPVRIPLTAEQRQKRQKWLDEAALRARRAEETEMRRRQFTDAENSTVIPAGNVWVVHGAVEYGDFTSAEEEANWPDEAICRECPPLPVVAWRVARSQVQEFEPGHEPEMVLFDGEYKRAFTDLAFGSTPAEAIAQARLLLALDRAEWKERTKQCAGKGHRRATIFQPEPTICECGERRVEFVERDDTDD